MLSFSGGSGLRGMSDDDFEALLEHYRRQLQLHCYRMVGSLDESEDLAQETLLRAWRHRNGFEGRSALKSWLYRIATNVCLDFLARRPRRELPAQFAATIGPEMAVPAGEELLWLDPCPERLLEGIAAADGDPQAEIAAKETVEIAFLAAIQHLPPRRRAVLILRDMLDWGAKETAAALGMTVPAVNSALPRARATLERHLPRRRMEWAPGATPSAAERRLLRRYVDAHERGDVDDLAALLREDVVVSVPPLSSPHGHEAFVASARRSAAPGRFRYLLTRANGQPAAASYVKREGDTHHRPLAIDVLRLEGDRVAELCIFLRPGLFAAFDLPAAL